MFWYRTGKGLSINDGGKDSSQRFSTNQHPFDVRYKFNNNQNGQRRRNAKVSVDYYRRTLGGGPNFSTDR
jgi:hypothetical protein